ncbi:60S ribosomal protein L31 [Tupaia chinensis]|uniref:60S ribosomal protein L31 n=1 Tax=Tupaia chinensis TaxID=246437 RepID=L9JYN4_TUPCH|nr:60S ribosomal protein L31 [Tupaia chinensis]
MAPAKKGGKKKGRSAINEVVTREYTINIHKCIHGVGFKKRAPRALKEIRKFATKEIGTQMPFCHQRGGDPGIHHQHSQVHPWRGLQETCPSGTQRNSEICHKGDRDSDVRPNTRLNKAAWARGIRNAPYRIRVRLSRKQKEDEDSPNKLYTLVTCVPATTFKNLQTVNMDEN